MERTGDNGSDGATDDSVLNTTNGNGYYNTDSTRRGGRAPASCATPQLRHVCGGRGHRRRGGLRVSSVIGSLASVDLGSSGQGRVHRWVQRTELQCDIRDGRDQTAKACTRLRTAHR